MDPSAGMDRISCASYHGLSPPQRARRALIPGAGASMVDTGHSEHVHLPMSPTHQTEPTTVSLEQCNIYADLELGASLTLNLMDVPVGLQAVMQCLLCRFGVTLSGVI